MPELEAGGQAASAARGDERPELPLDAHAIDVLTANHRAFLRFLERRVGSRAAAEDLLQEAFVKALRRPLDVPHEALVSWFYTVLRHAVVDRARRHRREDRALASLARELERAEAAPSDVRDAVCACIGALAGTLKHEYAEAIRAVDLDELPVKVYGARAGLTPSAAGVRLFRARQALRRRVAASCGTCADHGCLDCTCGGPARAPRSDAGAPSSDGARQV